MIVCDPMQCFMHGPQCAMLTARLSQADKFGLTAAVLVSLIMQARVCIVTAVNAHICMAVRS